MAGKAQINIKFLADLKGFSSQMQNAQRQIKKFSKNLKKVGTNLSIGVTAPILAIGAGSLKTAADMETLETSLAIMTGSAESGKRALADLADFTASTPFQIDAVGKSAKQLLAFGFGVDEVKTKLQSIGDVAAGSGNQISDVAQIFGQVSAAGKLTGERFNQLQERAIPIGSAIAQTMGIAESSVKDFIKNGKVGFTEFETAFNSLSDTGGLFAGSMDKQSKTLNGIFSTLKDNIALNMAEIGLAISDSFDLKGLAAQLISKIQAITEGFKNLSPTTKKWILVLAGIAAAIGPLLALAGTVIPAIVAGFAFMISPIGLIIAGLVAVGVAIATHWDPIKRKLVDLANYFIDLYNESAVFRGSIKLITLHFKNMFEIAKFIFNSLATIISTLASNAIDSFSIIGKVIKGALTFDTDLMSEAFADFKRVGISSMSSMIDELSGDWDTFSKGMEKNLTDAIETGARVAHIKIEADQVDTTEVEKKIVKTIQNAGAGSGPAPTPYKSSDAQFYQGTVQSFVATANVDQGVPDLSGSLPGFIADADVLMAKQTEMAETSKVVGNEVAGAFDGMSSKFISSLGLASDGFEGFVGKLGSTILKLVAQLMAQSIAQSIANSTASAAGTGPAAVFTQPAFMATAIGGVLAAFGSIPKFADGGIVSGPTLGIMGEYAGASSNPEVIAPLDKLKDLIQPAVGTQAITVNVIGTINGRDIKLALARTDQQSNRIG